MTLRGGRAAVMLSVVSILGCQHAAPSPEVAAVTDGFVVTRADLAHWQPLLARDRSVRAAVRGGVPDLRATLERIAVIKIALERGAELIDAETREVEIRDQRDAAVRTTYDAEVLKPTVAVTRDEARAIYDEHRGGFRKARGVRCLEIFCWAPEDLPDLRAAKRRLLERLRGEADTVGAFKEAASRYSDATSRVRQGSIGTILEDQVSPALRVPLFGAGEGVTDVIPSPDGLFLFYVLSEVPPRNTSFEAAADKIVGRLFNERLAEARRQAYARADERIELAEPTPTDASTVAVRVDGRGLTLRELQLSTADPKRVRERALALVLRSELERRGIPVPEPNDEKVDLALFRIVWPRLLERWRATHPVVAEQTEVAPASHEIKRWTFDLLVLDGCQGSKELFEVFRSLHDLGEGVGLETLGRDLRQRWGLEPTIRRFDRVLTADIAGLGPEINWTLSKRLEPGDLSRPLHLIDTGQVVVVDLVAREVDEEAGAAAAVRAGAARSARAAVRRFEGELLRANHFEVRLGDRAR